MFDAPDADDLRALSARIGADPLLVQGPGGNTSLKADGLLWVKASGAELADALTRDIFVPVHLPALRAAIDRADPACVTSLAFVAQERNKGGLRPSIETTMHALLAQRVVVHVHCVATLAYAVRQDAEAALAPRLAGLNWIFVPFILPGLPLAQAIAAKLTPDVNVIVLGNHGLVVAGATAAAAAGLLTDVAGRLDPGATPGAGPDLAALRRLCAGTDYAPAGDASTHALALDPARLRDAACGSLYPDHLIFLGPSVTVLGDGEALTAALARAPTPAPLILAPGLGALLPAAASAGAWAMARCLGDVLARVPPEAELSTLSPLVEATLLNWDAEKYRRALNAARG